MDKYGVDENAKPDEKRASDTPVQCPECGKELQRHGQILLCPEHGSKPFEK